MNMDIIAKFTVDHWLGIAGIVIPILLGWLGNIHIWLWSLFKKYILNKKIEVISPSFDLRFSSLNTQTKIRPYLDEKGHMSTDSLLANHKALFQSALPKAGKFRTDNVYIKSYSIKDKSGGTVLVSSNESITNVMPPEEVHLTLNGIIDDWNKKVSIVSNYGSKDKIEFVSRFHLYFEMIHPFLDGNGRVGRALLEEQLSYLFGQIISFKPDMKAYHLSIIAGAKGEESNLRKLISDQVKSNT